MLNGTRFLMMNVTFQKVVLLGEQSASNTDGVGSNPTALAHCRRGSMQKGAGLVSRIMLVRIQSSALGDVLVV